MTTTDDRPATTCPRWCGQQEHCRGEHFDSRTFVPATGGRPERADEDGARFPVVGIGIDFSELDGDEAPQVCLWLTGGRHDAQVYLRPREAEQVIEALQARLLTLEVERLR